MTGETFSLELEQNILLEQHALLVLSENQLQKLQKQSSCSKKWEKTTFDLFL